MTIMLFTDPIDAVPALMTIRYVLTAQEFIFLLLLKGADDLNTLLITVCELKESISSRDMKKPVMCHVKITFSSSVAFTLRFGD
ncbi:unnamed protein product [Sphenostylis stenocarpa]|uniref:Uncharacterized protein n=1 Tax=Sphenostylis stenocarpa TaxID=92480 RepID=A0AA86TLP3_9FABA|nr:unnamed protein product [Sphenostylis stenocarpa]